LALHFLLPTDSIDLLRLFALLIIVMAGKMHSVGKMTTKNIDVFLTQEKPACAESVLNERSSNYCAVQLNLIWRNSIMKKKIIAVALLSALAVPAFAASDVSGVYLVGAAGSTTNIKDAAQKADNVGSATSLSGLIGYRLNSIFAVEAGMVSLAQKADYTVPVTVTPVGGTPTTYTSVSLSGTEFAAVIHVPLSEDLSVMLRGGYANFERTENPSPAEVETAWKGTTYGLGVQYLIPHQFSLGRMKMQIGFRAGVNRYNLKDPTGLLTDTPSNSYGAGVIKF
jgi:hypothetical protein